MRHIENEELFRQHKTWKEFQEVAHNYVGRLPRAFADIDDKTPLNAKQAAELLEMNPESVRRWFREGKVRVISPVGQKKVYGEDLKEFLYQWWRKDIMDGFDHKVDGNIVK